MDETEANTLLNKSRDKIDEIDEQILNLIIERTSLAHDIAISKKILNKDLFDSTREDIIHDKLYNLLEGQNINKQKVIDIFDLLATISKEEQKKYLD